MAHGRCSVRICASGQLQHVGVLQRCVLDPDLSAFTPGDRFERLSCGQPAPTLRLQLLAPGCKAAGKDEELEPTAIFDADG